MEAKDIIRPPDPRQTVRADVREVVRDVGGKPHLFLRVKLTGWFFPKRANLPFLLVEDVLSRFVVIAPDGLSASAYFDRLLPNAERISFGYGRIVTWDFDVPVRSAIDRLDRTQLPQDVVDPFPAAGD
jgi:hypothetical protein